MLNPIFIFQLTLIMSTVATPIPRFNANERGILPRRRPKPYNRSVKIKSQTGPLSIIIQNDFLHLAILQDKCICIESMYIEWQQALPVQLQRIGG